MPDEPEEDVDNDDGDAGDGDDTGDSGAGDETPVLERLAAMESKFAELVGAGADNEPAPVSAPGTTRDGVDIRSQVKEALAEVADAKDLRERVEKVEKVVERPPVKQSRLSRAMWGRVEA
jgi:hypothetical protein